MVSSLAAQLAQGASLNSAILVDRSRRKTRDSYLFTGQDADLHDLESIHALGLNGFLQLVSLNPSLEIFEDAFFSDAAKSTDRTLLSPAASDQLDKTIASFLPLLGPYLMDAPTGKVIEWLVQRFRINEFNIESTLSLFLPYHESPHFAKMNTILHIKQNSTWSFLLPFKSAAQAVPRIPLVAEMIQNSDVARFVTSLLPNAIKGAFVHRALVAFNAACLHDFILGSKTLNEGTLAHLLPALLEPLQTRSELSVKDMILGSYILLATLSQKFSFAPAALLAIVVAMSNAARRASTGHFINAVISVCEPQEELEDLPEKTVKTILRLVNIDDALREAHGWAGIEKLLGPLLKGLVQRSSEDIPSTILQSIVTSSVIPRVVVKRLTALLLSLSLRVATDSSFVADAPTAASAVAVRALLSQIQQRQPDILHEVADEACEGQDDETVKEGVDQLILSLSSTSIIPIINGNTENIDMIVASTSADSKVRAIATKSLVKSLADQPSMLPPDSNPIHSALLARIQDTSIHVLSALYEDENASTIAPLFAQSSETYVSALSSTLASLAVKPKRPILKAHLTYLIKYVWPLLELDAMDVTFHQALFPFLLFSKGRQKTADCVWEVIQQNVQESGAGSKRCEWLSGCAAIWKASAVQEKEDGDGLERMGTLNQLMSDKIAENIHVSNNYTSYFAVLLSKLDDSNTHVRVLTYLITRSLLTRLSGQHQIDAAHNILRTMDLQHLSAATVETPSAAADHLDDASLGKLVVQKPTSKTTSYWLQVSVAALAASVGRPEGLVLDWLSARSSDPSDNRGHQYVELMRSIYQISVSSASPQMAAILRDLFINLKADALAFLIGISLSSSLGTGPDKDGFAVMALDHSSAFLRAHLSEPEVGTGVDFQTILPSLLVVLQSNNAEIRQATIKCLALVTELTNGKKFSEVYAFDVIYGAVGDDQLQYLSQDDLKRYLSALSEYSDHLGQDPDYITTFHHDHISRVKSDKKKDAEYKNRVLCYLLSHINAHSLSTAQLALLKSISAGSDVAKAQLLAPTIRSLVSGQLDDYFNAVDLEEFARLLAATFDESVATELNNAQSVLWDVFCLTLRYCFRSDTGLSASPRSVITRALERGLFAALTVERKLAVCTILLDIGAQDATAHTYCKRLLSTVLNDVPLVIRLLQSLEPDVGDGPRASKRAKLADGEDDVLARLSLLAEVLGSKELPGSLDLLSRLLETLNKVIQSPTSTQTDVAFIEQSLMSAIENAAGKVAEAPNLTPSAIRLDILVELIRNANNPQTFHQALILISTLARLAPDSVLHNIMPIFTFMGSNVFHRDDAYSLTVVRKTVDCIVPVMTSSLREKYPGRMDLYIGSRAFLAVFTDAANHIPRHRRTSFFAHLVDVLGPKDFLAPICLLLVQKMAARVVRQSAEEVQGTLSLPISLLHHYSPQLQTFILTEALKESYRLASRIIDPESTEPTFLDETLHDEHPPSQAIVYRRRAQSLILFVSHAVKTFPSSTPSTEVPEGGAMSDLISTLALLASLKPRDPADEHKIEDIAKVSRSALSRALNAMPAGEFVHAVEVILNAEDAKVQGGALDLFTDRLLQISDQVRRQLTPVVNKITEHIRRVISQQPEVTLSIAGFRALASIGRTMCPGEESQITDAVPLILVAIRDRKTASAAMTALSPLPLKLGPRILPFFRDIVSQAVILLREGSEEFIYATVDVLRGLLTSIPTFWSPSELAPVIKLCFDHTVGKSDTAYSTLVKAIAKRAPSKVLLPTMTEMWTSLATSPQRGRYVGFFDLLQRSLRIAPRPAVQDNLRVLFQVFVDALEVVSLQSNSGNNAEAEPRIISAFVELVVKLNEVTFKPLFRKLYDWAFVSDGDNIGRRVAFCHVYIGLLDYFKGLMNPYMSFLLQPFVDILKSFRDASSDDLALWTGVVQVLSKTFGFDSGTFWRDDKLRQIIPQLVGQVPVCVMFNSAAAKTLLLDCLGGLTDCATEHMLLKSINTDLLMHTRSEDSRLRLFALTCSESLWKIHGGKLLGFASETSTFIAECSEDENDMVVRESLKLKDAVESVAGNINGL